MLNEAQRMLTKGEQLSRVHVRRTSLTLNDAGMNIGWIPSSVSTTLRATFQVRQLRKLT